MALPVEKFVVATNENDILDRFWKTGGYYKRPAHGSHVNSSIEGQAKMAEIATTVQDVKTVDKAMKVEEAKAADGAKAHEDGVNETLSPAMDILVSSNFERLLWFLAYEYAAEAGMDDEWNKKQAGQEVEAWLKQLKAKDGFSVNADVLRIANKDFESERVSDEQTLQTIKQFYALPSVHGTSTGTDAKGGYILDPHSAIGVAAALRSIKRTSESDTHHISLATAHPAKFQNAVKLALETPQQDFDFDAVLPQEFVGLEKKEKRVRVVPSSAGWEGVRTIIEEEVEAELKGHR